MNAPLGRKRQSRRDVSTTLDMTRGWGCTLDMTKRLFNLCSSVSLCLIYFLIYFLILLFDEYSRVYGYYVVLVGQERVDVHLLDLRGEAE